MGHKVQLKKAVSISKSVKFWKKKLMRRERTADTAAVSVTADDVLIKRRGIKVPLTTSYVNSEVVNSYVIFTAIIYEYQIYI